MKEDLNKDRESSPLPTKKKKELNRDPKNKPFLKSNEKYS
jgi:hypothetical protein